MNQSQTRKKEKGRPKNSWRRPTTEEMTKTGYTWQDRARNAPVRSIEDNCQWPMLFKRVDMQKAD